jgi:hypothetical protein
MTARDRYATAAAFRTALEQRLRTEAQTAAIPLTRLRKEAAFYRLLARLNTVAPRRWAFKGGLSLIARLGEQVRGTKDADANWRATRAELEETLSAVEGVDLGDWFGFTIGDAHVMLGEGDGGALRYPSRASLDGRLFEQLNLDINIVGAHDPRPVELVTLERHIFEFIGEPPLQLPMVTPAQQLAEKLHALVRTYDGEHSSRAKDLFDMLVIADLVRLPAPMRWPTPLGRHSAYGPLSGHRDSLIRQQTGPSPGRDSSANTRADGPTSRRPSLPCASSGSHYSTSVTRTRTGTQHNGDGSNTRSRSTEPPRTRMNSETLITRVRRDSTVLFLTFAPNFGRTAIDMSGSVQTLAVPAPAYSSAMSVAQCVCIPEVLPAYASSGMSVLKHAAGLSLYSTSSRRLDGRQSRVTEWALPDSEPPTRIKVDYELG